MKRYWNAMGIVLAMTMPCARLLAAPCLSSRASPQCSSFYVTEFGYAFKLTSPLRREYYTAVGDSITSASDYALAGRHLLFSELGVMYNINPDYAVGFTHFIGWDAGHSFFGGAKLRARRWLNEKASIDVSGGAVVWRSEDESVNRPSFIGGASVNFSDWQGVDLTITSTSTKPSEYIYYETGGVATRSFSPRQRELGVYLGHRLASKPGLVMNGVALVTAGVVVAVIIAVLSNSN